MHTKELFSELGGFALYDPLLIGHYMKEKQIGRNLLNYLTTSLQADQLTENGLIIPILNIPPDYYQFDLVSSLQEAYLCRSEGWVLQVESGEVHIAGLGYLTNFLAADAAKKIVLPVDKGWYSLSICSKEPSGFDLNLQQKGEKPIFSADMDVDYGFED